MIILENYYQIITVVIGCVAFLSPIAVSLINNLHNSKMRVKEMAHERELKRIELHHELEVKQLDVYYKEKKEAFEQFLITAGRLLYNVGSTKGIPDLHAVAAAALLGICTASTFEGEAAMKLQFAAERAAGKPASETITLDFQIVVFSNNSKIKSLFTGFF